MNEEDPAWIREMLQANPDQLAQLKQNNPRLAEALESGNLEEFSKVLSEQQVARREREAQRLRMLNADPFDLEAQRMIAQEIEQKNIDQNMELAMEASPESFGSVIMLYINCVVNGHKIKAFVDSGAQATIMSQKAAERCNIMRLVDRRWAGVAKGVGTQKNFRASSHGADSNRERLPHLEFLHIRGPTHGHVVGARHVEETPVHVGLEEELSCDWNNRD